MTKPDKFIAYFSSAILLDAAERGSRATVFAMLLIAFFHKIGGARSFFETIYSSSGTLLFVIATIWGIISIILHKIFNAGSPKYNDWCKRFLKQRTGKTLGFRLCVYITSSLIQFVAVLLLSIILKEYLFSIILLFLTISTYIFLYNFPRIINFLYTISVGQSQLIFMISAVSLLIIGDYFGFYSISMKSAVLILALRLSLLYFVKFIILSTLAIKKRSRDIKK